MPLVVDASVAASWYLPDESDPSAAAALEQIGEDGAIVPQIWWFDVRNTFLIAERKGRVDPTETSTFLERLSRLPIRLAPSQSQGVVLIARQFRLTCYDAAYIELAARLTVPLATLDRSMAEAARRADVAVMKA
jgi:predicted nucleic acid-binding protein